MLLLLLAGVVITVSLGPPDPQTSGGVVLLEAASGGYLIGMATGAPSGAVVMGG